MLLRVLLCCYLRALQMFRVNLIHKWGEEEEKTLPKYLLFLCDHAPKLKPYRNRWFSGLGRESRSRWSLGCWLSHGKQFLYLGDAIASEGFRSDPFFPIVSNCDVKVDSTELSRFWPTIHTEVAHFCWTLCFIFGHASNDHMHFNLFRCSSVAQHIRLQYHQSPFCRYVFNFINLNHRPLNISPTSDAYSLNRCTKITERWYEGIEKNTILTCEWVSSVLFCVPFNIPCECGYHKHTRGFWVCAEKQMYSNSLCWYKIRRKTKFRGDLWGSSNAEVVLNIKLINSSRFQVAKLIPFVGVVTYILHITWVFGLPAK